MNWQRLKLMRTAARVARVHTMPTHYQQSVGEHTFGVMAIVLDVHPSATSNLLRACLYHDAAEAITGDVPAPAKWKHPYLKDSLKAAERAINAEFEISEQLQEFEQRVLKYADWMELLMFSLEEMDGGDLRMASVARNIIAALNKHDLTAVTPNAKELYDFVVGYFEKHYALNIGEGVFNGWPDFR